ncbi:hypothetical protein ACIPY3_11075 [Paenarthrobacter sp. NPDC089714]|uniref:hypothetical protein n=1 Tax=unclassified Paenarthrobacter TaxID=2634190 RepID=UPI003805FD95
MNLPLFHDPLQGSVTVDAPLREPRTARDAAFRRNTQPRTSQPRQASKPKHGSGVLTRSARQDKVAEDLQALIARTADRH